MAVNILGNIPQKFYNYLCEYGGHTVLHGPQYFLNHGFVDGGKEVRRKLQIEKDVIIEMSRFDR